MDIEDIIAAIESQMKRAGWYEVFHPFMRTVEFRKIVAWLCDEYNDGGHFYPSFKHMFEVFFNVKPEKVRKIVITERRQGYEKGVLYIPQTFTHDGEGHYHYKLWRPFLDYIIDYFS
jgi:hypothetical protein